MSSCEKDAGLEEVGGGEGEGKSLNAVLQDKLDRHGCTKLGYKFNEPLIFGAFTLEYASNLECKSRQFLSSRISHGLFARPRSFRARAV